MTPEERRRLDRHLDRLERVLQRCNSEVARQQRRERLARWRAKIEKKPPDGGPTKSDTEDEPKH